MKKLILTLLVLIASVASAEAQFDFSGLSERSTYSSTRQNASVTFRNQSDYTMTIKILYAAGGRYSSIILKPHSSSSVSFSNSGNFKLKIKAVSSFGDVSYHDGGKLPITCTSTEWTEGEMSFRMSSYGSGLGPKISAKQFESDY